jgi:DNA repair protein RecO (recombination protein O)
MDVRKMRVVHLNGALRSRTLSSVVEFYRLHVPEFPEIKSLNVLAEVFS